MKNKKQLEMEKDAKMILDAIKLMPKPNNRGITFGWLLGKITSYAIIFLIMLAVATSIKLLLGLW